jgi:hypothetical protein
MKTVVSKGQANTNNASAALASGNVVSAQQGVNMQAVTDTIVPAAQNVLSTAINSNPYLFLIIIAVVIIIILIAGTRKN